MSDTTDPEVADVVSALQSLEERLRDLAYDRLRLAAEEGDAEAEKQEKNILKARRAIERAIVALGAHPQED